MPKTKGGARPPAKLSRSAESYEMSALRDKSQWSDRELRAEYSRLRSIARKRLERFEKSGFDWSEAYKENVGKYKPIKNISGRRELEALTRDVSRFITAKLGSVAGQIETMKRTIKTLEEHGYGGVSEKNYRSFGEYMEYLRDAGEIERGSLSSERAADLYRDSKRLNISANDIAANFEFWMKNEKSLSRASEIIPKKKGASVSSREYAEAIGISGYSKNKNVNISGYINRKRAKMRGV